MFTTRVNQQGIFQSFERKCVTALLGSRRVGKSTLVEEYVKQNQDRLWAFLNMDSLALRQRIISGDLQKVVEEQTEQQIGGEKKIWVAIDEAQKCPELFDQIKILYDEYKTKNALKFILTGSGFLTLHRLGAETLAGRIELHYLREFCLRESVAYLSQKSPPKVGLLDIISADTVDFKGIEEYVASRAPFRKRIEASLLEQLIFGGLPEILQEKEANLRNIYLGNYLQTYLEKDVQAITSISDLDLYHKLMKILADQTGSIRQDDKIITTLGCARDTLKKYRGILLATLVYQEVFPFIGSTLKRLVKSPKGYLTNNGLVSYLSGLDDVRVLEKTGLIGHRFENWFLRELQVWLDGNVQQREIYYWRTSGGVEVDFVAEKKRLVFPFEVTYSKNIQDKKVKNLRNFLSEESKASFGFYVYMGDFYYDKASKICFIPAWALG